MPRAGEMQRGEKSVEIVEKDKDAQNNLVLTSDKKYLWDTVEIAEERSADGVIIAKRFYSLGFVDNDGTSLYYTQDHLGSIRELTDSTQAVRARYDYDPYGRMTKLSGDRDSVFGYTGHFWHGPSGLNLALFRAYDPNLGRWLSRDPFQSRALSNLYLYVNNNPINFLDSLGLCECPHWSGDARRCLKWLGDKYISLWNALQSLFLSTEPHWPSILNPLTLGVGLSRALNAARAAELAGTVVTAADIAAIFAGLLEGAGLGAGLIATNFFINWDLWKHQYDEAMEELNDWYEKEALKCYKNCKH